MAKEKAEGLAASGWWRLGRTDLSADQQDLRMIDPEMMEMFREMEVAKQKRDIKRAREENEEREREESIRTQWWRC